LKGIRINERSQISDSHTFKMATMMSAWSPLPAAQRKKQDG